MSAGAVPLPKLNFTGGEIGEEVSARPDLEIFHTSTESNLNLIPQPFGGIRRRPPTGFIDYTHPLLASNAAEWIIPFRYSDTQSYIISFYDGFMRFHTDAALVLDSSYVPPAAISFVIPVSGTEVNVTVASHSFAVGELYIINGSAMVELNGREFDVVAITDVDNFRIQDVSAVGRANGAGGTLTKAFSITHPYAVADLPSLRYSQTGDTLVITHPGYPPKKLVRGADHDEWTLTDAAFEPSVSRPFILAVATTNAGGTGGFELQYAATRVGYDGSESLPVFSSWLQSSIAPLGDLGNKNTIGIQLEAGILLGSLETDSFTMTFSSTTEGRLTGGTSGLLSSGLWDNEDVYIEFTQTGLFDQVAYDATNTIIITLGVDVGAGFGSSDYPFTLSSAMPSVPADSTVIATLVSYGFNVPEFYEDVASWRLYRRGSPIDDAQIDTGSRDSELWGLLAEIPATVPREDADVDVRSQPIVFTDYAQISVDNTSSPPVPRRIFNVADDYPVANEFHEQRLVMGGSNNDPRIVDTSKSAAPFDFNLGHFVEADGSLRFPIIGRTGQAIQHLVSVKELIILTDGGEWIANTPGQPLLPETLAPKEHSTWGSSHVRPAVVGNSIVFVQFGGHKVRELKYQLQSDLFVAEELSILARHLFRDNPIIDMMYVEEPVGILWALLEDGNLASMTYVQERGIWAWAHHDFGGTVKSIASIREENETDFLYMLIERLFEGAGGGNRTYLERVEEPYNVKTNWGLAAHVDSALAYEPSEDPVNLVVGVNDNGDGTFNFELGALHTLSPDDFFYLYDSEGVGVKPSDLGVPEGLYQAGPTISGSPPVMLLIPVQWLGSNQFNPVAGSCGGQIRHTVTELSGLFHWGGEDVCVWGDEGIEQTVAVSAATGKVTLPIPVSRATAGQVNAWGLRMLKIDDPSGVVGPRTKRTSKVIGRFLQSQRPQAADGDTTSIPWANWVTGGVAGADPHYGPKTGVGVTALPSSYDEDSGQIVLSGEGGGPFYLLSLIPEVLIGD